MTFIDRLFDSLETPGPNQRWLECNGNVARKAYEEMIASADTRPEGRDSLLAPFTSGAVAQPDAQSI